jgi:hypothetical protein
MLMSMTRRPLMGHFDCGPESILFLPLPIRHYLEYCGTIAFFSCGSRLGKGKPVESGIFFDSSLTMNHIWSE